MTIRPEFIAALALEAELGLEAIAFTGDSLELAGRRCAYVIDVSSGALWLFTHGLDDTGIDLIPMTKLADDPEGWGRVRAIISGCEQSLTEAKNG